MGDTTDSNWRMQLEQNVAAVVHWLDSVGQLLWGLPWLLIHFQAQFKVLILTLKALDSSGPGYLKDSLIPYKMPCLLRSSEVSLLTTLPLMEVRKMEARNRLFSMLAP